MVKLSAVNKENGRPVLGIGLSRENCERLLDGQPIMFDTDGLPDIPCVEVFLFGGESEQSMTMDMLRAGALTPDRIVEDPSLANIHRVDIDKEAN